MKLVYANEAWCLGCHLCEYYCAFAASGETDMVRALKGKPIVPRIRVEDGANDVHFAVNCRHCKDPVCVKGCIAAALSVQDGVVVLDRERCVGCFTCVALCPYGAIMPAADGKAAQKCRLCLDSLAGEPACVRGCPNGALVFEDRG